MIATRDSADYIAFEREHILPHLHDADPHAAHQTVLSSRQPRILHKSSPQNKRRAWRNLQEAVLQLLAAVRTAPDADLPATLTTVTDELMDVLCNTHRSVILALRFGMALGRGPVSSGDLTEITAAVYGRKASTMPRPEYMRWRFRALRMLDTLTLNNCPIFEHRLQNGQIVYAIMEEERE